MQKWLARLFLFWLLMTPFSVYYGFPHLLKFMEHKARDEVFGECIKQTHEQPEVFDPARPAIAQNYCECLRDGVVMQREDVFALLRHRQPDSLTKRIAAQAGACGNNLMHPGNKDAQVLYF